MNQKEFFNSHEPRKLTKDECNTLKYYFPKFICKTSYVVAESTGDYNCIGWGVGIKQFLDPRANISIFYNAKSVVDIEITPDNNPIMLFNYKKDQDSCLDAVSNFYKKFKHESILSEIEYYAKSSIQELPKNNTIAFYFKECMDIINSASQLEGCGISHAARYINQSWTSKFGSYVLATHSSEDVEQGYYGEILCYLEPA